MKYTLDDVGTDDRPLYSNLANPFSHPNRMAVFAALQGLNPPELAQCRVLELGCANGGNLLPLAESMPNATFVGIDQKTIPIRDATETASRLAIPNIEFHALDFADIDDKLGDFDFIICHGVYCWVEPEVQRQILTVCEQRLKPDGMAHINLNVRPGSWLGTFFREYLQITIDVRVSPEEQVIAARSYLQLLSTTFQGLNEFHTKMIREATERLLTKSDFDLFHGYLDVHNHPISLRTFHQQLHEYGLRHVADLDWKDVLRQAVPVKWAEPIPSDNSQREQLLDYLESRGSRHCLVCRSGTLTDKASAMHEIRNLYVVCSPKKATTHPNSPPGSFAFTNQFAGSVITRDPRIAAMLEWLEEHERPARISELEASIRDCQIPPDINISSLEEEVISLASGQFLELSVSLPQFATRPPKKPKTTRFANYQLQTTGLATNLRNEIVKPNEADAKVMQMLNGLSSAAEIAEQLSQSEASVHDSIKRLSLGGLILAE